MNEMTLLGTLKFEKEIDKLTAKEATSPRTTASNHPCTTAQKSSVYTNKCNNIEALTMGMHECSISEQRLPTRRDADSIFSWINTTTTETFPSAQLLYMIESDDINAEFVKGKIPLPYVLFARQTRSAHRVLRQPVLCRVPAA